MQASIFQSLFPALMKVFKRTGFLISGKFIKAAISEISFKLPAIDFSNVNEVQLFNRKEGERTN